MSDIDAPMDVSYSGRQQLPAILTLALIAVGLVVLALVSQMLLLLVPVVLVFGTILIVGIVNALRSDAAGTVLRLDPDGVTVRGSDRVPWSDLSEVVIGTMRPEWLVGSRRNVILAFMPRPGVDLPGPPSPGRKPQRWGGWLRHRLYGTNLLMLTSAMSVSAEEIAAAAERWGELPIHRIPFRPARRWGTLLIVGAAVGAVIAGVRVLLER